VNASLEVRANGNYGIQHWTPGRVLEFKAFRYTVNSDWAAGLPLAPGAVLRNDGGRSVLLHFAAGRWLAPDPTTDIAELLEAAVVAGAGAKHQVDGKWQGITIAGPGAERAFASALDVSAILAGRGCAATVLFDCPSIIWRDVDGFGVWTQSSYAQEVIASLERARQFS
jgi:heterotetrameric sarcosine oxidase gamma subunit